MGKLELVVVLALGIALLFWLLFRNPPEPVDPRDPSKAQSDGGARGRRRKRRVPAPCSDPPSC